jgi:signal transduction histidine kinase
MSAGVGGKPGTSTGPSADTTLTALRAPALVTKLDRGTPPFAEPRRAPGVPRSVERLLRIPLPMKIIGANTFLLVATIGAALAVRRRDLDAVPVIAVIGAAFVLALLVNVGLVKLAVRPMTLLENTVDRIWHGDLNARVPASLLADRHVARVGRMFNILLDGLVADRARTRRLAVELIDSGDRERAAISRELHDSTAQSLAALVLQLSAMSQGVDDGSREALMTRIDVARSLATATLEEVRLLAHTTHPRVLDDLGLVAALRRLARETTADGASSGGVRVSVVAREGTDDEIPSAVGSVLYRVAQEAVRNASRHSSAKCVEIRVWTDAECASLEVSDDGVGFDAKAERAIHAGIGLFTMSERVALIDGDLHVSSRVGGGTSVVACVPLRASSQPRQRQTT